MRENPATPLDIPPALFFSIVMPELSTAYKEIRQFRSNGQTSAAIARLRTHPPTNELDAFEAVVSLFVCGEHESALRVCRTHRWKEKWAIDITGALTELLQGGDGTRSLALSREAVAGGAAPYDAVAIHLMILQQGGMIDEAAAFIERRLRHIPPDETFLLTLTAEIALGVGNWRNAYRDACAVHAADPNDYRALMVMSEVTFTIGNIHESLGHALTARMLRKGSPPAVLQVMRCHNKLGNFYSALGAFETLGERQPVSADMHVELGKAYEGLQYRERAISEYRAALGIDAQSADAVRGLLGIYAPGGYAEDLAALKQRYAQEIDNDYVCLSVLGIEALNRGDLDEASRLFKRTAAIAERTRELPWPLPEARIRHDSEQLELLSRRGKLSAEGRDALSLLKRYDKHTAAALAAIPPDSADAHALNAALNTTFHVTEPTYPGPALGDNDYAAIEEAYFARGLVVIDNFLSPGALEALRRYSEESTVWKTTYQRGYHGAMLGQGFCPRVLLAITHELKQALPRVIGDCTLLQAWGYKYDQRLQGINLHADFAEVNVNFWIAPDDACVDTTNGGLVVWDKRVPDHWTFSDYNTEAEKLAVYVKVHEAGATKIPHRANRCVLFDSKLVHRTDDMHFKPGYENRRVNVTLLYGRGFAVS